MSKKRFLNEEQIIAAIDSYWRREIELHKQADELELLASKLVGTKEEYRCEQLHSEIHKLRVKAHNIVDKKLPLLADKLSTIRTPVLVACDGEDGSVPA